ncbi:PaaX family transcriptional regulator [Leucobacter chromiireducens]|uniref:PaaX family transcriptional regulator n=1 Tax=Leucobacter chromiireducens TaxID=283877 RepID=UPI000F632690|nr:PaaX family transcriptional regulator C-terminal domain-containing protein [Leucobacter chromiireducens]
MSAADVAPESGAEGEIRYAHPRRFVLSLLGELRRFGYEGPFRAVTLIQVLAGAGISASAARAALDRFAVRGLLERERAGRGVNYRVTELAKETLDDASSRVHAPQPFAPSGPGWTLVTFSVPEGKRGVRHQLRSALTWAGFAPLRDGLWIGPGQQDPEWSLRRVRAELQEADVVAFHALDLASFPMANRVSVAWDLAAIRAAHEWFLDRWEDTDARADDVPPLSRLTHLVADWLTLLRRDPGLACEYLGEDWPAERSAAVYRARRAELQASAGAEAARLLESD